LVPGFIASLGGVYLIREHQGRLAVLESVISKSYGNSGAWVNRPLSRFLIRINGSDMESLSQVLQASFNNLEYRPIEASDTSVTTEEKEWMENIQVQIRELLVNLERKM
ncbi:hypothetical protein MO867_22075, partial [Microbulbifer sp. OS29]